jgi:signal peptidase I
MKSILSVFKKIFIVAAIFVCSISVLLLIFVSFSPIKTFQIFRVMSGSMEPNIKTGSIVLVKQINPKELNIGDIITFSTKNITIPITHRIVQIAQNENNTKITTMGDANKIYDVDQVTPTDIKGKVIYSLPYLGYLSVWTKTPLGFIFLIIVPAILIIINEIFNIRRTVRDEIKKRLSEAKLPIILIIFLIGGIVGFIKPTSAFFSDGKILSGNIFSTGNWATPTITPTLTPDPTAVPTPTPESNNIANHIVISEVQIDGGPGKADHDFIELYNPTGSTMNLDNYRLVSRTGNSSSDSLIKSFTSSAIVPAHGFYLWASKGDTTFPASIGADASTSASLTSSMSVALRNGPNDTGTIIDALSWNNGSTFGEGTNANIPPDNGSLERKALSTSDFTSMTSGIDALKGNGYDSNNSSTDFILRAVSQPQNSGSAPESL